MTYIKDLSKYDYLYDCNTTNTKNIGWLDNVHGFSTGTVSDEVIKKLERISKISVNRTRGLHSCEICGSKNIVIHHIDGEPFLVGDAEIRVFSAAGNIYAAPNMLLHYIINHNYMPPEEFLDAIISGPIPPDEKYFAKLTEFDLEWVENSPCKEVPIAR